jgi:hypothetical protein
MARPSGSHGRAAHHLDRQREVRRHPAHHRELLVVLLAEVRPAGPDDGEELGHHGGDAGEVRRPAGALERLGHLGHRHGGEHRPGVHLGGRRHEEHVDAGRLGQLGVVLEVPGVGVEVLAGTELQGVHEDGRHHHVAVGPGGIHQAAVPGVEVAHGGHEPDGAPGGAGPVEVGPQPGDGLDGGQGHSARTSSTMAR